MSWVAAPVRAAVCVTVFSWFACFGLPGGSDGQRLQPVAISAAAAASGQERITVTGTRIRQGDGVQCPKLRGDAGATYSISYLEPSLRIGDRVTVTGVMAHMPTCLGPVIKVEDVIVLDGG